MVLCCLYPACTRKVESYIAFQRFPVRQEFSLFCQWADNFAHIFNFSTLNTTHALQDKLSTIMAVGVTK